MSSITEPSTSAMLPPARSPRMGNPESSPAVQIRDPQRPVQGQPPLSASARDNYTTSTPGLHRHPHTLSPRHSDISQYSSLPDTARSVLLTTRPLTTSGYGAGAMIGYSSQPDRLIDTPPFNAQENYYEITCEGVTVIPNIEAKIEKGFFFSSDRVWTCYRRNYFAVQVSYGLTPWIPNGRLYLTHSSSKAPEQVQSMAVSLAAVDGTTGKIIELIQHTPKRDKGPQIPMKKELLQPTPPGKRHEHGSYALNNFQQKTPISGPQLPLQNETDTHEVFSPTSHANNSHQHAFERIQFKSATANNGKRRAQQQYYHLIVELWANVQNLRDPAPRWVKVAARSSHPVVVRGRSPSHYSNEEPHNAGTSSGFGGAGVDDAPGYGRSYGNGLVGGGSSPMSERMYRGNTDYLGSNLVGNHSLRSTFKDSQYIVENTVLTNRSHTSSSVSPSLTSPINNGTGITSGSQELKLEAEENAPSGEISPEMNEALHGATSVEVPKQPLSTPLIEDVSHISESSGHPPSAQTHHRMFDLLDAVIRSFQYPIQILGRLWQPSIPPGYIRVYWTCRCGRQLYADFEKMHQAAAIEFAKQAAGPSNAYTVSSSSFESDTSTASSNTRGSNSRKSSTEGDTLETPPSSASSDGDNQLYSIIPDEKERHLLLCVNSEIHRIDLAHVDLTPKYDEYGLLVRKDDHSLFKEVKEEYEKLRGNKAKNIIVVPKTIQFIKFELIYRRLSGECVGNFEMDKIPSKDEAKKFGYHLNPCPPDIGELPIMPHLFMHSFREPGDHTGSLVVERLPKKIGKKLSSQEYPGFGWGIYIIEGYNWKLLRKCVVGALFATFIVMLLWSILRKDVQGGAGIGQYSVAVLALALPVYVLEQSSDQ